MYNNHRHVAEIGEHIVVRTGQRHCLTKLAYLKCTVNFQSALRYFHTFELKIKTKFLPPAPNKTFTEK